MKRITKIMTLAFVLFSLIACSSKPNDKDITKKIDNKDSFILVAASTTCSACKQYEPILKDFSKQYPDIDVQIVHIDKLKDSKEFQTKYNIEATPTTIYYKDGERKSTKVGLMSKAEIIELYDLYV
ncbi:MAG: thioredoxin family protein, partial [Bacilli bacterium]